MGLNSPIESEFQFSYFMFLRCPSGILRDLICIVLMHVDMILLRNAKCGSSRKIIAGAISPPSLILILALCSQLHTPPSAQKKKIHAGLKHGCLPIFRSRYTLPLLRRKERNCDNDILCDSGSARNI